MAKRQPGRRRKPLEHTAESVGAALGRVAARLDTWKAQRAEIARDIHRIVTAASAMLNELGGEPATAPSIPTMPARAGRGGRVRGYKMSDETRAKLRAAWQRRKARAVAKNGGGKIMSDEARAKISAAQKRRWAARRQS
jgi:hypothetical protein